MIREFSYSFNELAVNQLEIATLLGYPEGILPEPFSEYLAEAVIKAETLCNIRGAIYMTDQFSFSDGKNCLTVGEIDFNIGKTIARELRDSEMVAFFICTAGKSISDEAQNLLMSDNPVLGYVFDVLGSVTVETATDKIHQKINEMIATEGQISTNRYSPGYCQWSVADQHKLFSFFPDKCCGISLTHSALMYPIKSVSGIIGIGKKVKFREYTCDLCNLSGCFYRNRHKEKHAGID